eukprot:542958-Rhodomonas_salina.1
MPDADISQGGGLHGFFATGDAGELRGGGGGRRGSKKRKGTGGAEAEGEQVTLHVIDRVKSFFKLSNGEYVSPVALEHVYR